MPLAEPTLLSKYVDIQEIVVLYIYIYRNRYAIKANKNCTCGNTEHQIYSTETHFMDMLNEEQ